MSKHPLALVVALVLTTVLLPQAPAQAASPIRFTTIYYNSPGTDTGSNASLNAEWVRIHNFGSRARSLTGWTLRDRSGHVYRFPAFTLRPGATVTVHTGRGRNTATNLYWGSRWYIWNNTGDKAILRNQSGVLVDSCAWRGGGSSVAC